MGQVMCVRIVGSANPQVWPNGLPNEEEIKQSRILNKNNLCMNLKN